MLGGWGRATLLLASVVALGGCAAQVDDRVARACEELNVVLDDSTADVLELSDYLMQAPAPATAMTERAWQSFDDLAAELDAVRAPYAILEERNALTKRIRDVAALGRKVTAGSQPSASGRDWSAFGGGGDSPFTASLDDVYAAIDLMVDAGYALDDACASSPAS